MNAHALERAGAPGPGAGHLRHSRPLRPPAPSTAAAAAAAAAAPTPAPLPAPGPHRAWAPLLDPRAAAAPPHAAPAPPPAPAAAAAEHALRRQHREQQQLREQARVLRLQQQLVLRAPAPARATQDRQHAVQAALIEQQRALQRPRRAPAPPHWAPPSPPPPPPHQQQQLLPAALPSPLDKRKLAEQEDILAQQRLLQKTLHRFGQAAESKLRALKERVAAARSRPLPVHSPPPQALPAPLQAQPAALQAPPTPLQAQPAPRQAQPALLQAQPAPLQAQPAPLQPRPAPLEAQPAPLPSAPVPEGSHPLRQPQHPVSAPDRPQPAPLADDLRPTQQSEQYPGHPPRPDIQAELEHAEQKLKRNLELTSGLKLHPEHTPGEQCDQKPSTEPQHSASSRVQPGSKPPVSPLQLPAAPCNLSPQRKIDPVEQQKHFLQQQLQPKQKLARSKFSRLKRKRNLSLSPAPGPSKPHPQPGSGVAEAKIKPESSGDPQGAWKPAGCVKMLKAGDQVFCAWDLESLNFESAVVVATDEPGGRVYVHYTKRDRRLDRWVPIKHVRVPDGKTPVKAPDEEPMLLTRAMRRQREALNPMSEREEGNELVDRMEREREERTKVKNVMSLRFGKYIMDAWYFSPFPGKYGGNVACLYMCEFCLSYVRTRKDYQRHCAKCTWTAPPGTLIYEDPGRRVQVFEVDGWASVAYCQRLCLLGKLFLDHKTLFFDVTAFNFYVITFDGQTAGFFSKEKPGRNSEFNLACIMCMPQHQRKGIGRFLISFSYELSRREGKPGSPERPLSDLGQVSYRSYWTHAVISYALTKRNVGGVSIDHVAEATGIHKEDVATTLKSLNMLHIWKGERTMNTTAAVIDNVTDRMSDPHLPFVPEFLEYRSEKQTPMSSAEKAKSAKPVAPISSTNSKRKRSARKIPLDNNLPPARTPPPPSRLSFDSSETITVHSAIRQFVLQHNPKRVLARINSPEGVLADDVIALASSCGLSMPVAMQSSREIAKSMLGGNDRSPPEPRTKKQQVVLHVGNTRSPSSTPTRHRALPSGAHPKTEPGVRIPTADYKSSARSPLPAAVSKQSAGAPAPCAGGLQTPARPRVPKFEEVLRSQQAKRPARGAGAPRTPPPLGRSPRARTAGAGSPRTPPRAARKTPDASSPGWPSLAELQGPRRNGGSSSSRRAPPPRARKRPRDSFSEEFFNLGDAPEPRRPRLAGRSRSRSGTPDRPRRAATAAGFAPNGGGGVPPRKRTPIVSLLSEDEPDGGK